MIFNVFTFKVLLVFNSFLIYKIETAWNCDDDGDGRPMDSDLIMDKRVPCR